MIRYFFLLRKTESGRQNQNSLPFLFMGKILSLLKRIKISKGEIKWKENILSTGFKSVLYKNSRQRLQLFKDRDKKLEPIKDRNYLVGYFNYSLNIQKYLNKKWKLTDYVPPFTIE